MAQGPYWQGQSIRLSNWDYEHSTIQNPVGGYRDETGALVDPPLAQLAVKDALGKVTPYALAQLTKDATGLYEYILVLSASAAFGTWYYAWSADPTLGYYGWKSFAVERAPV